MVLIQLRAGTAPLYDHLHRIDCAPTATCPACLLEPETVRHFLLKCPKFAVERTRHFGRLGRRSITLSYLLNSQGALKPLFAFINDTGRLRGTFGSLEMSHDAD